MAERQIYSINPYNGKTLKSYEEMTSEQITASIAAAHEAYQSWKRTPYVERAALLFKVAALFQEREQELAELMSLEMGKKIQHGRDELGLCVEIFKYYAEHGEHLLAPVEYDTFEGKGTVVHQPIGVVYGIQPWNFPFYQPTRFTAPNLMAGNVVLTKHASNVPQISEAFAQLIQDAGAPQGVYTNLVVAARRAGSIIDDDRVQGVSFTGSNVGGAKVAEQAGRNVKKTVMELGGVDPCIVLEDADLDLTMERFLIAKLHTAGQICQSPKRIILTEPIADAFIKRAKDAFETLMPGDPLDESTGYGPLCTEKAAIDLEDQIARAVDGGAKIVTGGKRNGAFIEPTIITDIPDGNPAACEELFGPVASVFVVADEDSAVELANDSSFGLGGCVYTRDLERGRRVAERLECGCAFVNHNEWTYASMPMGGVKKSGYGRELGDLGIKEFVNQKLIRVFD